MVERIMPSVLPSFTGLTDAELLTRVRALAHDERRTTATLIAALTELDTRRLYLREGFSSLFSYCTQALRLSEDAAYNRIRTARVAAKWPIVLEMIADGSVTVTAVRLLSDVLTHANHDELLRVAHHKTKREVEELVARVRPQPSIPATIRRVATPDPPPVAPAPISALLGVQSSATSGVPPGSIPPQPALSPKPVNVAPLSQDQYKIQFTIPKATHDKLRRVQDLMRHTNPTGDPAVIFDRALTLLLDQLEKARLGTTSRPQSRQRETRRRSRHIPSAVKREVWRRDDGRCAFVGAAGRCSETGFLEYHHVTPYADGGDATTANIQLRCRAHNAYEAEEWFGASIARERHDSCANWFQNG